MIAAFIQARMSSKRFPHKVLKPILGRPMLALEIERVKLCETIDQVIVLTSTAVEDMQIVDLCKRLKVSVFQGDLENVLERFYQAALTYKPDHIVRLTGDCPLADMKVIDAMVRLYLEKKGDYGTNCMPPTYPDGLDAEIFTFKALREAHEEARLPSYLEHISLFFEERPQRFKIVNLASKVDHSALRWTVDETQDFELVSRIFEALYPVNPQFGMRDVLELLKKNPGLALLNKDLKRNEGLIVSKEKDKAFLKKAAQ